MNQVVEGSSPVAVTHDHLIVSFIYNSHTNFSIDVLIAEDVNWSFVPEILERKSWFQLR